MAYRADTGTVSIKQGSSTAMQVEPLPQCRPGDQVILRHTLLPGSADPWSISPYEPFLRP